MYCLSNASLHFYFWNHHNFVAKPGILKQQSKVLKYNISALEKSSILLFSLNSPNDFGIPHVALFFIFMENNCLAWIKILISCFLQCPQSRKDVIQMWDFQICQLILKAMSLFERTSGWYFKNLKQLWRHETKNFLWNISSFRELLLYPCNYGRICYMKATFYYCMLMIRKHLL